jgi:hypothetical protein
MQPLAGSKVDSQAQKIMARLQSLPETQVLGAALGLDDLEQLAPMIRAVTQAANWANGPTKEWLTELYRSPVGLVGLTFLLHGIPPMRQGPPVGTETLFTPKVQMLLASQLQGFVPRTLSPTDILRASPTMTYLFADSFIFYNLELFIPIKERNRFISNVSKTLANQKSIRDFTGQSIFETVGDQIEQAPFQKELNGVSQWFCETMNYYLLKGVLPPNYAEAPSKWRVAYDKWVHLMRAGFPPRPQFQKDNYKELPNLIYAFVYQLLQEYAETHGQPNMDATDSNFGRILNRAFATGLLRGSLAPRLILAYFSLFEGFREISSKDLAVYLRAQIPTLGSKFLSSYSPTSTSETATALANGSLIEAVPEVLQTSSPSTAAWNMAILPVIETSPATVQDDFRDFFGNTPTTLDSDRIYQIHFLRQDPRYLGIQKIRFSRQAVRDITGATELTVQDWILAVRMGIARDQGQRGIKFMTEHPKYKIELKVLGSGRRLMGNIVDGVWEFTTMADPHR